MAAPKTEDQELSIRLEEEQPEPDGAQVEDEQNDGGVTEVESLCMNCQENGTTNLLLVRIPYFREVLIESFECPHCYYSNKTVKSAGSIQPLGAKYTLKLDKESDFERSIVKSETALFKIEDLDLEMPVGEGQYTNVEGILSRILTDLENTQPLHKKENPQLHAALDKRVIQPLIKMMNGVRFPFTISIDDPSGNSWIQFSPDDTGDKYTRKEYPRIREQNEALGLAAVDEDGTTTTTDQETTQASTTDPLDSEIVDGAIYEFHTTCPACTSPCTVNMQKVTIPHFKEVVLMSTVCDKCGYRTSDVKTGGAIPPLGKRITLQVRKKEDLSRDILKSESCALQSQELGLDVQPGTLGGRFTTVEGLLTQVRDQLRGQIFDIEDENDPSATGKEGGRTFKAGDSMDADTARRWNAFFEKLDKAIKAEIEWIVVLEDPLANSYVQSFGEEGKPDEQLTIEEYERTEQEEEELGLKDMKVEGYEADASVQEKPENEGEENSAVEE